MGAGAMAAILGLDADGRARAPAPKWPPAVGEAGRAANFNDPKQTVIAGSKAAVDQPARRSKAKGAEARAAAGGVGAVPLQPDEAGRRAPEGGAGRRRRRAPSWSSTTSTWPCRPSRRRSARRSLYRQAFGPVRWVEIVQAIRARGVTTVECGPGKVLAGWPAHRRRAGGGQRADPATLAEAKRMLA